MDLFGAAGFANFDIILIGLVAIGIGTLGVVVYFNNPKSITNRTFFAAAATVIAWGVLNLIVFRLSTPEAVIWVLRAAVFFAVWHAFSAFQLFYVFPQDAVAFRKWYLFGLVPFVALVSILTLTPFVFERVVGFSAGKVADVMNGPAIPIFGLTVVSLHALGLFIFLRKIYKTERKLRVPYLYIFIGAAITYTLILTFNFVFPALLNDATYAPFAGLFTFPYIILTAYALIKHQLLHIKVIATELLAAALAGVTLLEVISSTGAAELVFRTTIFILVLGFSYLLIESVIREVQQREQIEKLAKELGETNERQEGLLRFISHEVKGFLTKDMAAFAALAEGDFGALPPQPQQFVADALTQTRGGVSSVMDILKASNQKKGTTEYKKESFDLAELARAIVEGAQASAKTKGLTLSFVADPADAAYTFIGDKGEIGDHVLRNLVDNSINYTPSGRIDVSLTKSNDHFVFTVADTGVGITEEDKQRLFTEGGHGKESQKVNVHSTGYGLFIAKNIVGAHGGVIRAESEGAGKGSRFIVELPA